MVKKREANEHMIISEKIEISSSDIPECALEESQQELKYQSLLNFAQEIRKNKDVLGYILRGEIQATVDLVEQSRIVEYAMMASQIIESSDIIAESFNLGKIKNVLVEGRTSKVLCINYGQNKLNVFIKKTADPKCLLQTLT